MTDCHSDHCITCGDDGVAMRVERLDAKTGLASCVDDAGERSDVDVLLVEPLTEGESVLVHAGVALVRL